MNQDVAAAHETLQRESERLGQFMRAEMLQQPDALARFAKRRPENLAALRRSLPEHPRGVLLVARGSSDQAAQFGRYLCEIYAGVPVSLAAASVYTRYDRQLNLDGWVAVAISQSGETPEIVDVAARAASAGACTVAITNDAGSSLAAVCDVPLVLDVGAERAVPATKTFTTSMLAMAHLIAALGDVPWDGDDEQRMAEHMGQVLADEAAVSGLAEACAAHHPLHLGRAFTYSVAIEAALKFKETTGRPAEGYASGDLLHGPVAAVGEDHVVIGYAADGPVFEDVVSTVRLSAERGARSFVVAPKASAIPSELSHVTIPDGLPEPLSTLPMVARAQQLALVTATTAGLDPDNPGGLRKVTPTS